MNQDMCKQSPREGTEKMRKNGRTVLAMRPRDKKKLKYSPAGKFEAVS